MNKVYQIEILEGIVVVRFKQSPKFNEICSALDDIKDIRPGNLRLYNLTCGLNFSTDEIQRVAEYARSLQLPSGKVALVASFDITLGLLRAYEGYRREERIKHMLFHSEHDAMAWLKLPN
jgi:hypothetical protein